jgi:hypothetical protein
MGRGDEADAEIVLVAGLPGENEVEMILQVLADARRLVNDRDPKGTKSSGLPTPESCKSCGVPKAPPASTISRAASTRLGLPAALYATPTARFSSNRTFVARALVNTVRLGLAPMTGCR